MSSRSLEEFASKKLRSLERRDLRRTPGTSDRLPGNRIRSDDRKLISFSCNDYLGLACDRQTIAASLAATERFGAGAGASRLITGSHSPYTDLERGLAELKATEDAVVFGSGYLANLGIIPVVAGKPDLILLDELSHSCMRAGAKLSGATTLSFAHGAIVDVPLQMGTLSKAAGSYGGYLCASRPVCDLVRNRAQSLVFSTGLPPGAVAAATEALAIIRDDAARVARPLELARRFTGALGLPQAESAIVPIVVGANRKALAAIVCRSQASPR